MDYCHPIAYHLRGASIRCGQSAEEFEGIVPTSGKIKAQGHPGKFKGGGELCSSQPLTLLPFYRDALNRGCQIGPHS